MIGVIPPVPAFKEADGSPLEAGFLYFGAANQNPETNPITVYWDAALTQPAAQPIRTSGGLPIRAGTPSPVFVNGAYSITVRNKNLELVYSFPDATSFDSAVSLNARFDALASGGITTAYLANGAVTASKLAAGVALLPANNLSDVASASSALSNLNGIAKSGTQAVTAILQFPNNTNSITQADKFGVQQNLLYIDSDDGTIMGGSDVRMTWLGAQPLNMFRQHHHFRFTQVSALDPRLSQANTGGGSILFSNIGKLFIRTGAGAAGDGVELRSPNIPVQIIAGQRIYFYLECPAANNFTLEFGINSASGSGTFAKFTRTDAASEGNIFCKVSNGATVSSVDTAQAVGVTRRLYCIEIVSTTTIKMYVSTTMGVLQLYATFVIPTDPVPTATCYAFIKLNSNGAAVNKEVLLSQIYQILIE